MLLKALLVGLLIAIAEVINGNIRVRLLHARFGKKRAKLISFISGVVFIIVISWATLGWINPANYEDCLYVGLTWLLIMFCLDIYFGKQVFKLKWTQVLDDFNPMKGNLLSVGMIFLLLCPSIMFWFS